MIDILIILDSQKIYLKLSSNLIVCLSEFLPCLTVSALKPEDVAFHATSEDVMQLKVSY
jgi:hypothetical protein